jgi:hypothetical protein
MGMKVNISLAIGLQQILTFKKHQQLISGELPSKPLQVGKTISYLMLY